MGNVKGWYFAESWLCWSWCRILGEWLGITVRIYSLDPDWLRRGGGGRWFTVGLISKFNDINGTKNTQRYLFLFINNSCTSPWFLSSCFTQKFSFRISMLNRLWREKFLNLKPTLQNEMTGQGSVRPHSVFYLSSWCITAFVIKITLEMLMLSTRIIVLTLLRLF